MPEMTEDELRVMRNQVTLNNSITCLNQVIKEGAQTDFVNGWNAACKTLSKMLNDIKELSDEEKQNPHKSYRKPRVSHKFNKSEYRLVSKSMRRVKNENS